MPVGSRIIRAKPGATVFAAGDSATSWGVVVSGLVRECRFDVDGNRQLTGFRFAGEAFGVEPGVYSATIESLGDTLVRTYENRLSSGDPFTLAALDSCISRMREDREVASRVSVPARVAAFLLDLDSRGVGNPLNLAMPRADLADYLRTTESSISRTLTDFESRGVVERCAHGALAIRDRMALQALAGGLSEHELQEAQL